MANCDLIASSDSIFINNSSLAWNEFDFDSESISSATDYIPAFNGYAEGNSALRVAYGIGGWGDNKQVTGTDWSVPATLSSATSSSEAWSCYFEYTLSGASAESFRRRLVLLNINRELLDEYENNCSALYANFPAD